MAGGVNGSASLPRPVRALGASLAARPQPPRLSFSMDGPSRACSLRAAPVVQRDRTGFVSGAVALAPPSRGALKIFFTTMTRRHKEISTGGRGEPQKRGQREVLGRGRARKTRNDYQAGSRSAGGAKSGGGCGDHERQPRSDAAADLADDRRARADSGRLCRARWCWPSRLK